MTMKCSIGLLACLVSSAIVVHAQAPGLKSYSYPADGFRAYFPTEPKFTKAIESTKNGDSVSHSYTYESQNNAYVVTVLDFGKEAETADPSVLIEAMKVGMLTQFKGRLISEHKIQLSVVPGMAFEVEAGEYHYIIRNYMAGSTFYVTVVGHPIGNKPTDADYFLDSFGLITRTVK